MEKENSRRKFLKNLSVTAVGSVLAGKTVNAMNMNVPQEEVIKQIKPLGFQWETQDPFLFCVHHEDFYPEGDENMGPKTGIEGRQLGQDFLVKDGYRMYHGKKVPGFPGHPHRGFETVTVVRKGFVDHSDSAGAAARYGNGDVQWMTAAKGLQHAEMFPLIHEGKPNTMELFQIWLNLPKKNKMLEPHFKMLWNEEIPKKTIHDELGKKVYLEVIAGSLQGETAPAPAPNSWAADPNNDVAIWNIKLEAGAQYMLPAAKAGSNRNIYFYEGDKMQLNQQELKHYHQAVVKADSEVLLTAGDKPCSLLVLQGKPINEPVVQHGPFVMNTRQEIQQAFADYQATRFGGWPWDKIDPVHDRNAGRFAKHADGREEYKG
jgi:redox-sensitive bicupin YhaK (pirin superfamily)